MASRLSWLTGTYLGAFSPQRLEAATLISGEEARPLGSARWLTVGCMLISLGNAQHNGAYSSTSLALVVVGAGIVILGLVSSRARIDTGAGGIPEISVIAAAGFAALHYQSGKYGSGWFLSASRILTLAAVAVAAAGVLLAKRRVGRRVGLWFSAVLAVALLSAVLMIAASPQPAIDVWYMAQAATNALLHGHSFYTAQWTSGIPGEVSNQFVYLPGAVLIEAPFKLVFGDVRYALVAALAASAVGLYRLAPGPQGWLMAVLIVLLPKMTFGVEQAWNDPLLVALMVATVLAARSGHCRLAVIGFAAVLSCKQYGWLFIPAAAAWPGLGLRRTALAVTGAGAVIAPWAIADPRAFWQGAISYNLHLPPRWDSLSLYSLVLRHGLHPGYGLLVAGTLAGVVVSVRLARGGGGGFLLGSGLVMVAFDLVSKQAFFNEWFLALGLVVAGIASQPSNAGPARSTQEERRWRSSAGKGSNRARVQTVSSAYARDGTSHRSIGSSIAPGGRFDGTVRPARPHSLGAGAHEQ